jgi:predicted transposase YdaD
MMRESVTFQAILEEGRQEGRLEMVKRRSVECQEKGRKKEREMLF